MADDAVSNPGVGGEAWRVFWDGTRGWPGTVAAYVTGGSAGAWTLQQVDATHGLPSNIIEVGGSSFSLGQALAASSLPVVLTAAQIATLTPPPAITNYAIEGGGNLSTIAGAVSGGKVQDNLAQVGGAAFSLGQQLAASSLPIVLTASQLTTLTPPGAITNYALETGGNLATAATNTTGLNNTVGTAGSAIPSRGLIVQGSDGTNARALSVDSTGHAQIIVTSALPAGSNQIGTVGLVAGTQKIGIVTTDQTTHGTTDLVAADVTKVGGSSFALGQQLAAASLPIVLTASQLTTLTPPAAITNYALETGGNLATLAGAVSGGKEQVNLAATGITVPSADDFSQLFNGQTSATPQFAKISCAASGDNTIVAGSASKVIRVHSIFLTINGTAISVYFRDGTGGTAICADATNSIPLDKTGATGAAGFSLVYNPVGHFKTSAGNGLVINLSGAQGVCGSIVYSQV